MPNHVDFLPQTRRPLSSFKSRLVQQRPLTDATTTTTTTAKTGHLTDGGGSTDDVPRSLRIHDAPGTFTAGTAVHVQDILLAFVRTASRLMEMSSSS
jgi:hypothetical protein